MSLSEEFLKAWHKKEKELKKIELACKHPDKTLHYASCPYLNFWDENFREFRSKIQEFPK